MTQKTGSKQPTQGGFNFSAVFPYIAVPLALIVGWALYTFVLGDPANFEGGDPIKGHPTNVLGTVHKGGFIVPLLIAVNLIVWIFFIEQAILVRVAFSSTYFCVELLKLDREGVFLDHALYLAWDL
ncbi:MAG: hypothetical protein ACKO8Q_06520 [Bacteroidota bacterium]